MEFVSWEISVIVLFPALILCGYIYHKDKIEKEPISLLLILLVLGAISYVPVLMLESNILDWIDGVFEDMISFSADGMIKYGSYAAMHMHKILTAFIGIAVIEIAVKWSILYFCTRNNRNFNYLFDGIVYSVFVSLGFAMVENIRYAWINGWDMLVLRLLSSLPCHLVVGIIMGYYYTLWNAYNKAKHMEKNYISQGAINEERIKYPVDKLILSILIPLVITGLFLYVGAIYSKIISTVFYFVVFFMYGVSFVGVEKIASRDKSSEKFSKKLLQENHPEIDPSVGTSVDKE